MTFKQAFTSSVGKKLVMGLTGLFLIAFLLVHVGLNACIWADLFWEDNGLMFNKAAHFMGSNWVPRFLEVGLFAMFFIHIIQGYMITAYNNSRRPVGYAVNYGNKGSKWYSRSMAYLGTLLLTFLIMHIYHFWVPSRITGLEEFSGNPELHDLFGEMKEVFQNPVVVILYVLGCVSLAFHVAHGFGAAFRTLGVSNEKYAKGLSCFGWGFAIFISLLFALMPVSFYFGWIS